MNISMRNSGLLLAVLVALAWLPCAAVEAQTPRVVTGGDGRSVEIRDTSRIITVGGAVTEIVFALGYGERVVAADLTSTFPPAVKEKPNVGYMRALSAEGTMSLAPSLIIATEGSGPPDVVAILSRASVPFVVVPEGHDEAAVLRKVRLIASALGEEARGEAMAHAIEEDFRVVRAARERIVQPRRAVFVLTLGSGTPTIGGTDTSAAGIFALAGVENAMKEVKGYKPAAAEAMLAAAPEAVVAMTDRNHGLDAASLFALPAFVGTPAAREGRLVPAPSHYLTFGPRTPHAARDLAAAVYSELALPALPPRPWTGAAPTEQR